MFSNDLTLIYAFKVRYPKTMTFLAFNKNIYLS